ncbi:class I SAM-dependent methyltransferase [Roseibium aestuarii]|uniref:Class I SAM-dependent methyltransferase n=1 Tax=Roseibium aestuarii TaxID=2600299 RepID=A0ABW4K0C7_9HYPH|nr:class I SAM-dependent methyltransferase [Roseibium aestuarii]
MPQDAITGYESLGPEWIERTEAVDPVKLYGLVLDLLPETLKGLAVLDLGAGSGRDAAWLARRGAVVTAVEPCAPLREAGQARHRAIPIHWVDDRFPNLSRVTQRYGLILVTGVWHHLDEAEQPLAFQRLAQLLAPGGRLVMALRHGEAAAHHINFLIDEDALLSWAEAFGLRTLRRKQAQSQGDWNLSHGVRWTWLVLERPEPS